MFSSKSYHSACADSNIEVHEFIRTEHIDRQMDRQWRTCPCVSACFCNVQAKEKLKVKSKVGVKCNFQRCLKTTFSRTPFINIVCFPGGNLMLGLDEDTIMSTFNITDPLHRKALVNAINRVKEKGVKPASNLWEFKVCEKKFLKIFFPAIDLKF